QSMHRGRDFHHTNQVPVPRFGGLGLVAAFVVISISLYFSNVLAPSDSKILVIVALSSLAMFLLGFWDDLRGLGARWKLLIQIAIATGVYLSDIRIELVRNPVTEMDFALGVSGYFATVLWLVTLTNLINLIDGIDGLAGGICLMLMSLLAAVGGNAIAPVTLVSVGIAGALLGFLKFNYPPAKIYLGDGGAYFLGFLIGLLSIVNSNKGTVVAALIAPAFALALPLVDTGLAVLRRGLRGLPLFRADQRHIHHRLINFGFSHERAVLALYAVSTFCLALAFGVFYSQGRLLPLFTGLLFVVLAIFAHLSGFTKDWVELGTRLRKSLALRKEARYALTLSRWLEMEVERHNSFEEMWLDYKFIMRKLGFSRVQLVSADGSSTWELEGAEHKADGGQHVFYQTNAGLRIEFQANKAVMSEMLFYLLSDLASETWHKAFTRWQKINGASLDQTAVARVESSPKKVVQHYTPVPANARIEIGHSLGEQALSAP
ncbi:MAG TPA: MraY family glycosyltransferase, partial [Candidatus Methylacidiphilales bacterium]